MAPSGMSTMGAQGVPSSPGNVTLGRPSKANAVKGKVAQLGTYVQTNPMAIRVIGGIGGVGLTAVSIMGCFAIFNSFLSPIAYIQNISFLIFGLTILVVSVLPTSFLAEAVYSHAQFMSTLVGRGLFFLYLGALLFGAGFSGEHSSWIYLLIGAWMLFAAVIHFILRCRGVGDTGAPSQSSPV